MEGLFHHCLPRHLYGVRNHRKLAGMAEHSSIQHRDVGAGNILIVDKNRDTTERPALEPSLSNWDLCERQDDGSGSVSAPTLPLDHSQTAPTDSTPIGQVLMLSILLRDMFCLD